MALTLTKLIQIYKDAYQGHPRAIWLISGVTLINRMGTMVIPFLSVYLTTVLGYSLSTAGFILAAFGLGSVAGSYLGGKLSDIIGANTVMVGALVLGGLSFIAMQFFTSQLGLTAIVFLTAMLADAFRPAMSAYVGEHSPPGSAGRSMALIRIAINMGMALGPALGGFIAFYFGYNALFWLDGMTCITAGLVFLLLVNHWKIRTTKSKDIQEEEGESEPIAIYKDKKYVRMLIVSLLLAIAFLQYFHTVPVFIKTIWGFDERYLGAMMAINCILIVLIEMPIVDVQEKKKNGVNVMLLGLALFLGAFIPFFGPSSLLLYLISILFFTAGEILFLPFNNAYAINLSPEKGRGAYMAWYWIVWGVASVIAPIVGFQLVELVGYPKFWSILLVLICIAIALHLRSIKKGI